VFGYTQFNNNDAEWGDNKPENTVMKKFLILAIGLCVAATAYGDDVDFLTDYSMLDDREGDVVSRIYLVPNYTQRLADYDAVLVDQPEIFIADDSKYKGAKGDQLKALADVARLATIERLEAGGFAVADEPGPDVLYLRWAIVDLYLKKKKRGILSYTPVGFVVHATKSAAVKDLWKKIDIVELGIEIEISDTVSGEIIGAATSRQQGRRKAKGEDRDLVTWQELDALFSTIGERVRCNLSNARRPESDWETCRDIVIEPEKPEES